MKLISESGNAFELVVLRYEYPDITEDRWDSNWLVVSGMVTTPEESWRFVDACVTTFELEELADWLERLNHGTPPAAACAFAEPNLEFWYVALPERRLRLRFAHESAPPRLTEPRERASGVSLEFPLSEIDAEGAAADLREVLNEFPIRGGAA
jgi:hypothetical protein